MLVRILVRVCVEVTTDRPHALISEDAANRVWGRPA